LLWIGCGDHDTTVQYARVKAWAESLDQHGVYSTFRTYAGAHTWSVWRRSLTDFVPLLFTEER
jgi:enterochelin esterase-like enzyme